MITINANGQILSMCKCDTLVSDSIDVLELQFIFDHAWAGMVKTAQFTQKNRETQAFDTYNVLIDDMGMAYLPNEITDGVCIISVFGVAGGQRLTTAPLAVSVLKSGYIPDGNTPIPPTPDLYQQLLDEFRASSYDLPTASKETLGGVKVGMGLKVAADGTLSADGGGVAESVEWNGVQNKPETFPPAEHSHTEEDITGLSEVAKTGAYSSLMGIPDTFPPAEHSHSAEGIEGLSEVAKTGNYSDLRNAPDAYTLPAASAETLGGVKVGAGLSMAEDGTLSATGGGSGGTAGSVAWDDVQNKPESFPPAVHDHAAEDITGLSEVAKTGKYADLSGVPAIPLLKDYPIGRLWISSDPTSPASLMGGTWEAIEDCFIMAAGSTYAAGSTGGAATVKLTKNQLPNITGTIVAAASGNAWGVVSGASGVFSKGTADLPSAIGVEGSSANQRYSTITMDFGANEAHNNIPPYKAYYAWERVA